MKIKYLLLVLIVLLINSIAWASGNKCLPNEDSIHVKALPSLNTYGSVWFSNDESKHSI